MLVRDVLGDVAGHDARIGPIIEALTQHAEAADTSTPRTELKSVRQFRSTWSRLSAQKQVSQALGQAPKNAGPINSHMLVLRSLGLMRSISPDYLNRFMVHVDTLLCLDEADKGKAPAKKAGAKSPK